MHLLKVRRRDLIYGTLAAIPLISRLQLRPRAQSSLNLATSRSPLTSARWFFIYCSSLLGYVDVICRLFRGLRQMPRRPEMRSLRTQFTDHSGKHLCQRRQSCTRLGKAVIEIR